MNSRFDGSNILMFYGINISLILAILWQSTIGGLGGRATPFQLMFALTFFLSVLAALTDLKSSCFETSITRALKLFLACFVISFVVNLGSMEHIDKVLRMDGSATYWKLALYSISSVLIIWGGYHITIKITPTRQAIVSILHTILLACLIIAMLTLLAWMKDTGGTLARYNFNPPLTGSFGISTLLCIVGAFMVLPLLTYYRGTFTKSLLYVALLIFSINVVILYTRQGLISYLLSISIYTVLNRYHAISFRYFKMLFYMIIGMSLLYILFQYGLFQDYINTFQSIKDPDSIDVRGRMNALQASFDIFLDNPIVGVGYGFWYPNSLSPFFYYGGIQIYVASPHNGAAAIMSEFGILGSAIFTYLCLVVLRCLYNSWKNSDNEISRSITSAILSLTILQVINQLVSNSFLLPPPAEPNMVQVSFVLWVLIGLGVSLNTSESSNDK